VLVVVGIPLLTGLDRWDMGSDEAIYSYSVERMLETGDWLTPRAIPGDQPFFEKPPLKSWIVSGAMRVGLLPRSDAGMRTFDALFGAVVFAYVYLFGVRLAGPVCGVASALILFAFSPLLFEHGLRSDNMEAALTLSYAGGVFHFVRWAAADRHERRRREALAVALYFVLGFMTKFVAAIFLPMVLAGSLLVLEGGIPMLRQRWREWVLPTLAAAVLIAPWFIYQSLQPAGGRAFWNVLVGVHVYQRFAGVLAPDHLAPWYHYFTSTWRELGWAQTRVLVVAGLACLGYIAWGRQRPPEDASGVSAGHGTLAGSRAAASPRWLARVVLIWWLLPFVLMSLGTSKLLHYAYPYIPPLAIGGGLFCALALQWIRGESFAPQVAWIREWFRRPLAWAERRRSQQLLVVLGLVLTGLSAWTALHGPVIVDAGGMRVFKNGSIVRPLVFAVICLGLTRVGRRAGLSVAMAVLLTLLPIDRYAENVRRVFSINHPLRTIRDCALDVQKSSPEVARGALRASGDVLHHAFYYYMRHTGAWVLADPPGNEAAIASGLGPEHPMPVFVTKMQYGALARSRERLPPAVLVESDVVALLPGPFAVCVPQVIAAGAHPLDRHATPQPGS
jgi:4-amino-4-deoxy-L-arabinose transferase-like glycosyltransferase